jgi:CheY-like chemotaxis protein
MPTFASENLVKFAPRVLIVDDSADSREVLSELLERHGATTVAARRPQQAIELAAHEHVDLIVFDAESDRSEAGRGIDDLKAAASRNGTPIVILGTVRQAKKHASAGQFVPKPYHYGQLIHKIEDLLDAA